MASLNKEHAQKIVKKLSAQPIPSKRSSPHDLFEVRRGGIVLALISLRRGSNKDAGHGHLASNLGISHRKAYELAICTYSEADWVKHINGA